MNTGVHKRWNLKYLKRELASRIPERVGYNEEQLAQALASYAKEEAKIIQYADGDNDFDFKDAAFALEFCSRLKVRRAQFDLYASSASSAAEFRSAVGYWVMARLLMLGRNATLNGGLNVWKIQLQDISETTAMASSLGWSRAADFTVKYALQQLPLGLCWTSDDWDSRWEKRREPFARFVISNYADFSGARLPDLPPHPYEAPAYDSLLAAWRHPDPAFLVEPLLAVCDWHTHECMYSRSDKPSKNVDFINDVLMGWPVEIHMVYRLRERLGLPLPDALDHPLMQTPLGTYHTPCPMPIDELQQRVLQRAFSEIPGLAELIEPVLGGTAPDDN